jgi:hypothetical protein
VSDIFEEVDEELRAERARKLLQRYAGVLVLAAALVVAGVGGWQAWKSHQAKVTAGIAQQYLDALQGASGPPGEARTAALLGLERVATEAGGGYRTLSRLREAALKADTGDAAGAEALWTQVAGDPSADPLLRDAATLQWVLHQIGTGDPATLLARLKPLAAPDNPWHALADEAQALIDLQQGHTDVARETLKRLAQDVTAPQGVRGTANALLAQVGG